MILSRTTCGALFGPLPGVPDGNALTYEFELPERFRPWPSTTRLQRTFVLLDHGVGFAVPCWQRMAHDDGDIPAGLDPDGIEPTTWYVDLLHVVDHGADVIVRDLYIDVIVPMDGRHQRMLDLDEFADAIADGSIPIEVAVDALRRWQTFLDPCLHSERGPQRSWTDFPPREIAALAAVSVPLGPVVAWNG